jgi:NDP-sugar pyrophosphorylase family protein
MDAVILAAGKGVRMMPLTRRVPKAMIRIGSRPILEYIIEGLVTQGFDTVHVLVRYKKEAIMSYFKNGAEYGATVNYIDIGRMGEKGTAYGLLSARDHVNTAFLCVAADSLFDFNYLKLLRREHITRQAGVSMLVMLSKNQGSLVTLDERGYVSKNIEKPESLSEKPHIVDISCYIFEPLVFKYIRSTPVGAEGNIWIADTINVLISNGYRVIPVPYQGWRVHLTTPEDIVGAEKLLVGPGARRS